VIKHPHRSSSAIKIAIADDHKLFRKGLVQLLEDDIFHVLAEADNGKELIDKLQNVDVQVVLMDISMPEMNGFETTEWLTRNKPEIKVLALSMSNDDKHVIRMIRNGAKGYLLKDSEPLILKKAIIEVIEKGFFYSELVSGNLVNTLSGQNRYLEESDVISSLGERELQYVKWACSDLSHKEIAVKMDVSPRTVDGYRDSVFQKLDVQSRVGLALFAVKHKIYQLD